MLDHDTFPVSKSDMLAASVGCIGCVPSLDMGSYHVEMMSHTGVALPLILCNLMLTFRQIVNLLVYQLVFGTHNKRLQFFIIVLIFNIFTNIVFGNM